MSDPIMLARAAAAALEDEGFRRRMGAAAAVILSPLILLAAFFCSLGSGMADHNLSVTRQCFSGAAIPEDAPEEYRRAVLQMRDWFAELDQAADEIQRQMEAGASLDLIRVKAAFYSLYFGAEASAGPRAFADCFVSYEKRTRTIAGLDEEGHETEVEETYLAAVPIEDMETVWQKIQNLTGMEAAGELRANAGSVYQLIRYGYPGGELPPAFLSADGFCSPIGEDWRNVVTSEFGYRRDPFTGQPSGHSGIDLAVASGTPIRAALPGTVTVSKYNPGGYGYYVMLDHGNGLATLYAHCSRLLVQPGQTVEAEDVVALSGSTGRSTGPHLHLEVRVNGEKTDPRNYLP